MSDRQQIRKEIFLCNEFTMLAWNASVQRANIYKKQTEPRNDANDKKKIKFRKSLIRYVRCEILPQYSNVKIEPTKHIQNLENLVIIGTKFGSEVLEQEYKLGVAQKFLNLSLKYHWCMGWIKEPPHCPVDRIILSKTDLKGKLNWTEIRDIDTYKEAIKSIERKASKKSLSLAKYELKVFSRK